MVIKGVLSLLLIFNISNVLAENTIIAVVNNIPISLKFIKDKALNDNSNKKIIDLINIQIDTILQLEKIEELNIKATKNDINLTITDIAKSNNISLEELQSYPEFLALEKKVSEKISILRLQTIVTKNVKTSEDEILDACDFGDKNLKQIRIVQIIISDMGGNDLSISKKNDSIKSFLIKLTNHIKKGASFESLARLHSQHPSYANGGLTSWISVDSPTLEMLSLLKKNEISDIYLTDFGYAIAKKIDQQFINSNFNKCKEKLIYHNAEKFYYNWVKSLRENAYIKIYHEKL